MTHFIDHNCEVFIRVLKGRTTQRDTIRGPRICNVPSLVC